MLIRWSVTRRGVLQVELEWLEFNPSGVPYRVRRILMEKTNVYALIGKGSH